MVVKLQGEVGLYELQHFLGVLGTSARSLSILHPQPPECIWWSSQEKELSPIVGLPPGLNEIGKRICFAQFRSSAGFRKPGEKLLTIVSSLQASVVQFWNLIVGWVQAAWHHWCFKRFLLIRGKGRAAALVTSTWLSGSGHCDNMPSVPNSKMEGRYFSL